MLIFAPPPCDINVRTSLSHQQNNSSYSRRFSIPFWPARPAASLVALRSLQTDIFPDTVPRRKSPPPESRQNMSSICEIHFAAARSPSFSPTLDNIPEVFEYEPSNHTPESISPMENQDIPVFVLPDAATPVRPSLSLRRTKDGIISSPRAAPSRAATRVAQVLRNVLEADRLRRRRALRIYLKAIVFLKLLLKSHERYGALMATSGMYMQR